jgi:hypothetical protein
VGTVKCAVKPPAAVVVTLAGDRHNPGDGHAEVIVALSNLSVMVEAAANPVPVMVTVVPTGPYGGFKEMDGPELGSRGGGYVAVNWFPKPVRKVMA